MGVLIGIDPHKKSVNAAAATETTRESSLATRPSPLTRKAYEHCSGGHSASPSVAGRWKEPPVSAVPWLSGSQGRARR